MSPQEERLSAMLNACRYWLGEGYDTDAMLATLATAAVEQLDGEAVWLLVISGSGNAKTETVMPLVGCGALAASTITSEGALLSATSRRETAADASGGLLNELGERGILVIKDVTSILSMNADSRAQVFGALREVYDGSWTRKVGTDGGRSLQWAGRVVIIGAVTTSWDEHHAAIASMGDRFVLLRMDSRHGRRTSGRQALDNTGRETQMRDDLTENAKAVLSGIATEVEPLTDAEKDRLLAAADLVTMARTGVKFDRGEVDMVHAPEMPTRFAKQLQQIARGARAIGVSAEESMRLAIRCARDSMPPLRLKIIDHLATARTPLSARDIARAINSPRTTVDRWCQALQMLQVLEIEYVPYGNDRERWLYRLASDIDPTVLQPGQVAHRSQYTPTPKGSSDPTALEVSPSTDIRGPLSEPPRLLSGCVVPGCGAPVAGGECGICDVVDTLHAGWRADCRDGLLT